MLDFNGVGQQGTTAVGVIPPDSMVIVRLHIIMPAQGSTGSAVELTRSKSSTMEFLATELEVMEGQYKGAKIFHRFNVGGDSTPGQRKSVEIAKRQLCALLEVSRGVSPDDASPQATEARRVNGWADFEGMTFPILVGCRASTSVKKNDPAHYYVNNTLVRVVTQADGEFSTLRQPPYEIISAQPIPEFPVSTAPSAGSVAQLWGAPQAQAAPASAPQAQTGWGSAPAQPATPPPASAPMPGVQTPSWAQPAPAQQAQPSMDQVPF